MLHCVPVGAVAAAPAPLPWWHDGCHGSSAGIVVLGVFLTGSDSPLFWTDF